MARAGEKKERGRREKQTSIFSYSKKITCRI